MSCKLIINVINGKCTSATICHVFNYDHREARLREKNASIYDDQGIYKKVDDY